MRRAVAGRRRAGLGSQTNGSPATGFCTDVRLPEGPRRDVGRCWQPTTEQPGAHRVRLPAKAVTEIGRCSRAATGRFGGTVLSESTERNGSESGSGDVWEDWWHRG